ncbi:MAG: hypothetical protein ACLP1Y_16475 [Candidatus Acidiferrales bacterium]
MPTLYRASAHLGFAFPVPLSCSPAEARCWARPCPHLLVTRAALILPVSGCAESYPPNYSFLQNAVYGMYSQPLVMYLQAWLIAFGPMLFLLIFGWRESRRFLWEHQYQLVFLAGVAGLAWIGGTDTERYALFAMPIIFALVGRVIVQNARVLKSPLLIGFLAITQVISERLFWTIPDFLDASSPNAMHMATSLHEPSWLFLVPFGKISYLNLMSHFGPRLSICFVEYCFVGFALLAWLHHRRRRLGSIAGASGNGGQSGSEFEDRPRPIAGQ